MIDPWVNSLHRTLLRGNRRVSEAIARRREDLQEKAFLKGPASLSPKEKKVLLYDPSALQQLHQRVWETPDPEIAQLWGLPL